MRLVASHIAGCLLSSPHSMSSGGKRGLCISFRYSIWMRSKALQFLWALGSSQWTNYSTEKSFFPPAGSQREREVVASLSKHAAVRCYAKTPKDFLITSQFKKCWRLTPHPLPPLSPAAVWQIWIWNVAQLTCNILSQAFFNPSKNVSDLICCQSRQTVFRLQTIAAPKDITHGFSSVVSITFSIPFHRC